MAMSGGDVASHMALAGEDPMLESIDAMLRPSSIAIVGATERSGYGARFVNNLVKTKCKARIYPVNPSRDSVFGLRCYASVHDIPERVDLAAIILAADQVVPAFEACIEKGARSAIVISAGFAEMGTAEGVERQRQLQALARSSGARLCGPNCLGVANVAEGNWITSSPRLDFETPVRVGDIALISQSGSTCYSALLAMAHDRGIGFRYLIATGNEADLESSDYMRYLLLRPEVKAIAAVIEGFKNGPNFVRVSELALQAGKPIVVLKIGRSEAGARGASSHTAAMTGSDKVHDALFAQRGVVRVGDYDELLETTAMFAKTKAPRGNRVGAVSESGGIATFTADKCGEFGLDVPPLSPATREKLVAIMGDRGSAANPADLTMFGLGPEFPTIFKHLIDEDQHDLIVMSSIGGEVQAQGVVDAVASTDKPILFAWTGSQRRAGIDLVRTSNVPLFSLPGKAAHAARRLVDYHQTRRAFLSDSDLRRPAPLEERRRQALSDILTAGKGSPLTEYDSKRVLALFGIQVSQDVFCQDAAACQRAATEVGYPVALKISSPQIVHKTEVGGVRLGIADSETLALACADMLRSVRQHAPHAHVDGFLVQRMVTGGTELIVGVSRDAQFGPVLMLGLGGIFAEALSAAAWRVCPVTRREAREMISEIKGLAQILGGFRGRPAADVDAVIDTLVSVSRLAVSGADQIQSLDINPLVVLEKGRGAIAVDASIVPVA